MKSVYLSDPADLSDSIMSWWLLLAASWASSQIRSNAFAKPSGPSSLLKVTSITFVCKKKKKNKFKFILGTVNKICFN